MNFFPKNCLVTGGAGFIGSHFIHYCQTHYPQQRLINLDKLTYAACLKNLVGLPNPESYFFVKGDIADRQLVDALLREFEIDTIVHFAAETHVDRSIQSPELFVQTNILGTFALLEACRNYWLEEKKWDSGNCRFHHISTDEVYGSLKKEEFTFTEITPYAPSSPYSSSKAAADHLVNAYYRTYGLPITMTNCSNNYGPFQHREKFIPMVIHQCLTQQSIPVYGDGSNIRDWLYIEDHCKAIDVVIRRGNLGETYNVGGNAELSNLEVIYTICDALSEVKQISYDYKKLINFVNDRPGHDWRYAINTEKIKHALGWEPKEAFSTGILKVLTFHLSKNESILIN
ncbi:MAG: dTDP-glucose 4,6-dehydratase [Rickettsia endosymbiont of Ixodes persulcatus]|nr:dTDP-glucose 4,6-dehydratase [Rickettsia endosymbiont of Ixodes persulcatus]